MGIKLGICYCQKNQIKNWQNFAKSFEDSLRSEVFLEISQNFEEDLEKIEKEYFDIYFASFPISVYELYKRGYIPIAKLKKKKAPNYVLISNKNLELLKQKENIKIAILDHPTFSGLFIPLKLQFDLEFLNFLILKTDFYEEIIQKVLNKEVDLGIISNLEYFKNFLTSLIKKELVIKNYHYFMIPRDFPNLKNVKEALKSIDKKILELLDAEDIEFISFWEKHNVLAFCFMSDYLSEFMERFFISKVMLEFPYLGVAIYHDYYVYTNPYLSSLLKYTPEEFKKLKPEDLFYYEEDKIKGREIVKKRLKGEFFTLDYNVVPLKTKDNKKIEVLLSSTTTFYKGKYSGLVLLIDVTKQKRLERLNRVLKKINQILITSIYEKEIYEKILPLLLEGLQLKGVCIGIVDEEKGIIKPTFCYPEDLKVKDAVTLKEKEYYCVKAYKTKEIQIISDIKSHLNFKKIKKHLLSLGINSICAIPLIKDGKVVSILTLCSEEPQFFEEDYREVIEELQRNLSFALRKIDLLFKNYIINEFIKKTEEILIIADIDGKIEYINPYGARILELDKGTDNCFRLLSIPKSVIKELKDKNFGEVRKIGTYFKENKRLILDLKIGYIELSEEIKKLIILGKDLSREIKFEEERFRLRNYDGLTGLLNYQGFAQKVTELLSILRKNGILILLDIYNFSYINHFYGIETGDFCLKEIASKLNKLVDKNGILGRPVGDEFSIFLVDIEKNEYTEWVKKIINIFSEPLQFKDKKIFLEFNASVVIYPDDGTNFKELWQKANVLVNETKRKGPNVIEFFNPAIETEVEKVFRTINLIKRAIKENLFIFYYQPYFKTQVSEIAGLEALVRIKDGDKFIKPLEFIEYLENSPYIKDFEYYNLYKNLNKIKEWKIPISINISSKSFEFLYILEIISKYEDLIKNLPIYFIIEITEHTLAKNLEKSQKVLNILKSYNIKITLDDFGTGYSSLNYLKDFSIDIIKIDKSFIDLILKDNKTYYIVETVIKLAKNLGIKTLAEGVETEEQLKILQNLDCDFIQGFLLSKPLPEKEVEKIIKKSDGKK